MMKRQLFLMILLLVGMTAAAKPVTQSQAMIKAQAVLKGKLLKNTQANTRQMNSNQTLPAYYVFNAEDNGGFVIVSGDDLAPEILAFADEGYFDVENMSPAVAEWMESYEKQISLIASGKAKPRQIKKESESTAVAPFLKTLWHQAWPYNLLTPTDARGNHYVTGCIATALAQILYYYHAPLGEVPAVPAYTSYLDQPNEGLPATTFDWANMRPDYRNESNEAQQMAVAKLMQYCGYVTKMHYANTSVTVTWEAQEALKNFFGFDNSVTYMYKRNYDITWEDWEALIYGEVAARRPVIYAGDSDKYGGHAYLIDGYSDGLFHINWGFQGNPTGYFALSLADYYGDGDGWSQDPEAVIGIKLPDNVTPTVGIHADNQQVLYGEETTWSYTVMTPDGPDGEPTFICERTLTSSPGNYLISMERGTITNENLILGTGILTVTRAPLSVTTDTVTIMQGDPMPEFTLRYEGFMNGEDESVLTEKPTVTPTVNSTVQPGTYDLKVRGPWSTTNYNISYKHSKLIILPEPTLTITVHNDTITYGDPLPTEFTFDVDGEIKGGTPEPYVRNKAWPAADEYEIGIDTRSLTNFNIVVNEGKLVVLPAPLTISAGGPYTMEQGEQLPDLKAVYTGFKYDDDPSDLDRQPVFTHNVTSDSPAGTYELKIDSAKAKNYTITYQNSTITVTPAPQVTITAKDTTIVYGDPLPQTLIYAVDGKLKGGKPELIMHISNRPDVGDYDIEVSMGTVTNYPPSVTLVGGKLHVVPAPLTISTVPDTVSQGDEMPAFEFTYDGWKYDDNESVLTAQPVATPQVSTTNEVGTYEVTVSGAEAKNYTISYQNSTLTIEKLPIVWTLEVVGEPELTVGETTTLRTTLANAADEDYTNGIFAKLYREPEVPDGKVYFQYELTSNEMIPAHGQTVYEFTFDSILAGREYDIYLLYFSDEQKDSMKVADIRWFVWDGVPEGIASLEKGNPDDAVYVYNTRGHLLLTTTAAQLRQAIKSLPRGIYAVLTSEQRKLGRRGVKISN